MQDEEEKNGHKELKEIKEKLTDTTI